MALNILFEATMTDKIIKHCPRCSTPFTAREMLESDCIIPIGITVDEENPELAYFYFNHNDNNCHSTFMVAAKDFEQFVNPDKSLEIKTGQNGCEGHCLEIEDTFQCDNNCYWVQYRNFISKLMNKKKTFTV